MRGASRTRRSRTVERKRLDTAKQLLTIAIDEAATPAERQVAYRRVREELDGLISLSDEAIEVLEAQGLARAHDRRGGPGARRRRRAAERRRPDAAPPRDRPATTRPPQAGALARARTRHRHRPGRDRATPSPTPEASELVGRRYRRARG